MINKVIKEELDNMEYFYKIGHYDDLKKGKFIESSKRWNASTSYDCGDTYDENVLVATAFLNVKDTWYIDSWCLNHIWNNDVFNQTTKLVVFNQCKNGKHIVLYCQENRWWCQNSNIK